MGIADTIKDSGSFLHAWAVGGSNVSSWSKRASRQARVHRFVLVEHLQARSAFDLDLIRDMPYESPHLVVFGDRYHKHHDVDAFKAMYPLLALTALTT